MEGVGVLVKYHWKTKQSIKSLTQEQASQIQATNFDCSVGIDLR